MFHKKKAIEEFGICEEGSWLLDDGFCLDYNGFDHRNIGNFCDEVWTEAIKFGCISIFESDGYLWIRTNGSITFDQKVFFERLLSHSKITYLHVEVYSFDNGYSSVSEEDEDNEDLIRLYLTDNIAYQISKQEN